MQVKRHIVVLDSFQPLYLSEALLKYETLDAADVKTIIEQKKPPPPKVPQSPGRVALKPSLPLTGLQGIPATASQLGSQTAEGAS